MTRPPRLLAIRRADLGLACLVVALAGCGPNPAPPQSPTPSVPPPAVAESPAPWRGPPLAAADVPAVYATVWRAAENRATCAPLAITGLTEPEAAPRAATFSGGWGVAYDLPDRRSAFGVAGAGVSAWTGTTYDQFPRTRGWADGARAAYGPEGGTGPNELAYLRIPGQDCLYNVWSALGRTHLEGLLDRLRFVRP